CDVLVVGAGPAGLVAALAAARLGARTVLAEQDHRTGGGLLAAAAAVDGARGADWAERTTAAFTAMDNATLLTRTTVFGYYDHNTLGAVERVSDHLAEPPHHQVRQRLWRIHAGSVVLATGAVERPLVFGDNDRPGIMLASAARTYATRYAARPGAAAVVFTNNDSAYHGLAELAAAGVEVQAVIDSRRAVERAVARLAGAVGARHFAGAHVRRVRGRSRVRAVEIDAAGVAARLDCDLLCVSGGWNPDIALASQTGARPVWSEQLAAFVPGEPRQRETSAGAARGTFDLA